MERWLADGTGLVCCQYWLMWLHVLAASKPSICVATCGCIERPSSGAAAVQQP